MTMLNKNLPIKNYFFDIETSKVETNAGIVPVTYLTCLVEYNLTENKELNTIFNRTIVEAIETFKTVNANGYKNVIYCHNLSYEYRFIFNTIVNLRMSIDFDDVIFSDSATPIKFKIKELPNIEFRCSYALLGRSVKDLGKELGFPKLKYDYNVRRLPSDELTKLDYDYNKTDCIIVAKAIAQAISEGLYVENNIPLTKTALVRRNKVNFINKYYPTNSNGRRTITQLKKHKETQLFTEDFYKILLNNFKGGLVGSNHNLTNKMVNNVYSVDVKSSYPSVMMNKFPLFTTGNGTTRLLKGQNANNFIKAYLEKKNCYHFIGIFKIKGLVSKVDNVVLPISNTDKVDIFEKPIIDIKSGKVIRNKKQSVVINGKVYAAEEIILSMNEVDFEMLNKFYDYEELQCNKIYISLKQRYLPECETSFILSKFLAKEAIEDHDSPIRKSAKVDINSIFGEKVMKQIFPKWQLSENGFTLKEQGYMTKGLTAEERTAMFNAEMENKSNFDNNFNIYADGIWITSYARKNLMDLQLGIVNNGGQVVYVDTDSVKFIVPNEKVKAKVFKFIDETNKEIDRRNKLHPAFNGFKELLLDEEACKDIVGKSSINRNDWNKVIQLGKWQIENHIKKDGTVVPYKYFKSLGSKKYIYTTNVDDKTEVIKTVVAGCSTKLGTVLTNYANDNKLNLGYAIEKVFRPSMLLMPEVAGRTVSTVTSPYMDGIKELTTTDGIKLDGQFGGLLINEATYLLDIEFETAKTLYGLNIFDQIYAKNNIKPDIFTGTEIIRSNDNRYNELYENIRINIFEN